MIINKKKTRLKTLSRKDIVAQILWLLGINDEDSLPVS